MITTNITNSSAVTFQARYLNSESLKKIAEYAIEKNKFYKLNQARKNTAKYYIQTKLRVDVGDVDGYPYVTFARYNPKSGVVVPKVMDDLKLEKVTIYKSDKKMNPLKFALEKLIKLGNNAPENNMFKNVVIKR